MKKELILNKIAVAATYKTQEKDWDYEELVSISYPNYYQVVWEDIKELCEAFDVSVVEALGEREALYYELLALLEGAFDDSHYGYVAVHPYQPFFHEFGKWLCTQRFSPSTEAVRIVQSFGLDPSYTGRLKELLRRARKIKEKEEKERDSRK